MYLEEIPWRIYGTNSIVTDPWMAKMYGKFVGKIFQSHGYLLGCGSRFFLGGEGCYIVCISIFRGKWSNFTKHMFVWLGVEIRQLGFN